MLSCHTVNICNHSQIPESITTEIYKKNVCMVKIAHQTLWSSHQQLSWQFVQTRNSTGMPSHEQTASL